VIVDMHDDPSTLVVEGRELPRGEAVRAVVVCVHPWGMGLYVKSADQYGHVNASHVRDRGMTGPDDYVPLGTELTAVVLGYSGVGQLRLSTRLGDMPGMTLDPEDLPD
jgi:hypothetical protein